VVVVFRWRLEGRGWRLWGEEGCERIGREGVLVRWYIWLQQYSERERERREYLFVW
jgi:hypothetical protein